MKPVWQSFVWTALKVSFGRYQSFHSAGTVANLRCLRKLQAASDDRFILYPAICKRILDPTTKREFDVNLVAHSAYDTLARQIPKDSALESFYHYDPVRCLGETLETLDHYLRLVREFVFEEVRQSSFPHLPSRHRCIWLIPHDSESLAYWTSTLSGDQQIFEVSVTGKIHRANQEYLTLGTPPLNKLRQLAFKYWASKPVAHWLGVPLICSFRGLELHKGLHITSVK